VIARVFEPFFTTKEVGKGSGLGLSMVYGFVKQSNGHVSIYSEPGLGTTIRIYLPQVTTKSERPPAQSPVDNETLPRGAETVMVVEDDPFVRSYAVMLLDSLGYSVVAAVDGADALQKLRTNTHVDILFTDIVMPGGINGWELADLARQLRPGLPVLLTSGYALETLAKHGRLRAGAVVLTKPYRKADLARRLREVVRVSELLSHSLAKSAVTPTDGLRHDDGNPIVQVRPLFNVRVLDDGSGYVIDAIFADEKVEQLAGVYQTPEHAAVSIRSRVAAPGLRAPKDIRT
jgi:CheY-like chemotaxis protein